MKNVWRKLPTNKQNNTRSDQITIRLTEEEATLLIGIMQEISYSGDPFLIGQSPQAVSDLITHLEITLRDQLNERIR
jgi:hypothetical protein